MQKFRDFTDLMANLRTKSPTQATKFLTEYFSKARFGLSQDEFEKKYVDGENDGGMDFVQEEDNTFYIVQTKFSGESTRTSKATVFDEIHKICNSLSGNNPNKRMSAEEFVNSFRRVISNNESLLEVIWLTTDEVTDDVAESALNEMKKIRSDNNWGIQVDFVPFDRKALRRMVSDVRYGYIPYTGKRALKISSSGYIENGGNGTGIKSVVFSAQVVDLLKWIRSQENITDFLQKNIRNYTGDTKINRDLKASFRQYPQFFWYKHNGVIIFADSISLSENKKSVIMRNPQVVNGGQTITALFTSYDKAGRSDSEAEILIRVYRLPYEQLETYERGLEIIKALNSQNQILASDLHSTDPQQVQLEEYFRTLGYTYHRKRSKDAKSGEFSITMGKLALFYQVCEKWAPHEGVVGQREMLFEQKSTYQDLFPENLIERELESANHIVFSYILAWRMNILLTKFAKQLPTNQKGLSDYTKYFVLADCYNKIKNWRKQNFQLKGWRNWFDFLRSKHFEKGLWEYSRYSFLKASSILPNNVESKQEPKKYYRREEATEKFRKLVSNVREFNSAMNSSYKAFEREIQE